VPSSVYTDLLGISPKDLSRQSGVEAITSSGGYGGEPEELIRWEAGQNEMEEVEVEIGGFGGLKSFEVSLSRLIVV
jgi:hypothetical protein